MNIGCLFGTFDPPHVGHVAIAEYMRDHCGLDEVWLVVTPQNPFKLEHHLSADQHRSHMAALAVEGRPQLRASDFEFGLPRPSYTAEALTHLRGQYPQDRFSLIIGSDNLASFHRWRDPEGILEHHRVLVYPRPGSEMHINEAVFANHPQVQLVDAPLMDLSSTKLRQSIRDDRPVEQWMHPRVLQYVNEQKLYRDAAPD